MLESMVVNLIYKNSSTYINQTTIDTLQQLGNKMMTRTQQHQVIVGDTGQVVFTPLEHIIGIDHLQ